MSKDDYTNIICLQACITCSNIANHGLSGVEIQELSYRKQIALQLRTQYAEGIYRPQYYTVTLKSRLRITQSHWKRNRWIDHT